MSKNIMNRTRVPKGFSSFQKPSASHFEDSSDEEAPP
jgi:hypothetical protein